MHSKRPTNVCMVQTHRKPQRRRDSEKVCLLHCYCAKVGSGRISKHLLPHARRVPQAINPGLQTRRMGTRRMELALLILCILFAIIAMKFEIDIYKQLKKGAKMKTQKNKSVNTRICANCANRLSTKSQHLSDGNDLSVCVCDYYTSKSGKRTPHAQTATCENWRSAK